MARSRKIQSITQTLVEQAARLIEDGRHRVGEEWREAGTGLSLKFNARSASYHFRGRADTVKLGKLRRVDDDPADPEFITLEIAKHLNREARAALKAGRSAKDYVRTYRDHLTLGRVSKAAAHVAATHASARSGGAAYDGEGPWTWRRCVDAFLKVKVKTLKGRHAKQYERYLRHPAFTPIADKRIPELGFLDLFAIQTALTPATDDDEDGRANSTTMRCMSEAVAMLDWAKSKKPRESGLAYVDQPWWRQIKVDYRANKRRRAPEPDELARTIVMVERERAAETPLHVTPGVAAAFEVAVALAQRTGALVQLKRENIFPHPSEAGWRIAHWTADQMKTPLAHAVPIPPHVVAILERLWAEVDLQDPTGERTVWAFPSTRGDGHVNSSSLNQLFDRFRGKATKPTYTPVAPYKGKPGPKPSKPRDEVPRNLFAIYGVKDWTMHDGRRSLTNELGNAGLGGAASAILGHAMPVRLLLSEETPEEMMARTTSRHYFTAQQIPLKTQGMKFWTERLLAAIEQERRVWSDDLATSVASPHTASVNAQRQAKDLPATSLP